MASESNNFTAGGHVFTIRFSMSTVDELEKVGVRACNAADLENIFALFSDRTKLADVLWVCAKKKAKELSITKEQFEEFLGGDEMQAGLDALVEAFIRFSAADVRSAMRHAAAEFYRAVKVASDEFIAEMNAPPTPTTEVVAA